MKLSVRDFTLALRGEFIPLRESTSHEVDRKNTLLIIDSHQRPSWTVRFQLSHSRGDVTRWLVLKTIHQILGKEERVILGILGSIGSPSWFALITWLNQNLIQPGVHLNHDGQSLLYKILKKNPNLSYHKDLARFFNSFQPELRINRVWQEKKRFPPKRFIGVGHNDQGALSSSPKWEMVNSEEEFISSSLDEMINSLREFQELLPVQEPR